MGITLFDNSGWLLIARRTDEDGPEIIAPDFEWQVPQAGISSDERPIDAAKHELFEDTAVLTAEYLSQTDWVDCFFPTYFGPPDQS